MKTALYIVLPFMLLIGCSSADQQDEDQQHSEKYVVVNDTIPEVRPSVNSKPVASYSEKIPDELNDWKLAVDIYETPLTFSYLVKIQYKEFRTTDTLNIPQFGIWPKVHIQKGERDLSCIVGFEDENQEFKPYKAVEIEQGALRIRVLRHYRTGIFRKEN